MGPGGNRGAAPKTGAFSPAAGVVYRPRPACGSSTPSGEAVHQEEDTTTQNNGLRSHILCGSILCAVCTSFAFASYSLFLPAFLAEFHWARGAAALPFSLAMVCWGAMQPVAGALADRWGTRPVILGGILVSTLGFCTMGTAQSLWQIALGFGVLLGTATSACGSLMWALLIAKWFPGARRAAAVGILQAATPAAPLVLAPLLFVLMAQYGWRASRVSGRVSSRVSTWPVTLVRMVRVSSAASRWA